MLLMIDNYDSFTFNLVQYLQVLGAEVEVRPFAFLCALATSMPAAVWE